MSEVKKEQELTARQELDEIATLLHEADIAEKEAKERKSGLRPAFFALISEVVREEIPLARKKERVDDPMTDLEEWRAFNHPTWRIVGIEPDANGYDVTLEENEDLVKFEFEVGGYKFGRTIRMEGRDFKAEGFHAELQKARLAQKTNKDHPLLDLSDEVLNHLEVVVTKKMVPTFEVDEKKATEIMAEYPETMTFFQKYLFPGTPNPALMPIKQTKTEDE